MESAVSKLQRKLASMEARCERLESQLRDERQIGSELLVQIDALTVLSILAARLDSKAIGGYEQKTFCGNACRNIRSEIRQLQHIARQRLSALYEPIEDARKS